MRGNRNPLHPYPEIRKNKFVRYDYSKFKNFAMLAGGQIKRKNILKINR